jgi:hypothetical protein
MCGLEAAIAGTTVPQKKEPGHLSNPSKTLRLAPLLAIPPASKFSDSTFPANKPLFLARLPLGFDCVFMTSLLNYRPEARAFGPHTETLCGMANPSNLLAAYLLHMM